MESLNLDSINPRFKLGETSIEFCDCLGLVILHLRDKGYTCDWEESVKREITTWEGFNQKLEEHGFRKLKSGTFAEEILIVWREEDGTGHIGIYYNNLIYQMTPYGVQISSEIPATKRPVFWYY